MAPIAWKVIAPEPLSIVRLSVSLPSPSIDVVKTMAPSFALSSVSIVTAPSMVTLSLKVTFAAPADPSV